ncbi:MAG TPA: ATPase, T2SS/T4P/T4SS family [Actinomycetota bacterium]|nr:ATPase, T2SS/T4P/T4SS family [Actinomycetota bacterium]
METRTRRSVRNERQRLRELVDSGLLTQAQLDTALQERERTRRSIQHVLVDLGFLSQDQVPAFQALWMGFEYVDLNQRQVDPAAAGLLPENVMRRYTVIPLELTDDHLVVALSDPTNVIAIDDIRTITGRDVRVVVAARSGIEEALNRYRGLDRSAEMLLEQAAHLDEEADKEQELEGEEDAPIVKAINHVIAQAVHARASDIHIEPQERDVRIRFRIDGVLHEVMRTQKSLQSGMISRLKIMAELNIAERRVPQDGRLSLGVEGKSIDLRVATMPSVWGEEVVMRILDRSQTVLRLEDLGFMSESLHSYSKSFRKPYGAILVTGPTGSGKSTTLYATLNVVNDPSKKIITVEDPVEYRLPGLSQVQVNPKAGLTFARALRSILRSDPDIVMIGEIRDRETANIAVEAALTGHLVLSTLHTNDAPSAVTRLVEMGVEPFLVASALDCVLAQRLARRLCAKCKEPYTPSIDALRENGVPFDQPGPLPTLHRAAGCQHCSHTGYRGRVALVEVMRMSEEIERMVVERKSAEDIKRTAISQGMTTLREDGMRKLLAGLTSIEEVLRVVEGKTGDPAPAVPTKALDAVVATKTRPRRKSADKLSEPAA